MDVAERKPFTAYNLVAALETYTQDNKHSRDVATRWFVSHVNEFVLPLARRMRSDNLDEGEAKLVARFRLAEIEKERDDKQREIDALNAEARKLTTGPAA